jgi:two-component system OmpR family sensor kinase
MAQAGRHAGSWQSIRSLSGRTPLRVKLITALLALVAIALAVSSVAGLAILRNDLLGPYDSFLSSGQFAHLGDSSVQNYLATGAQQPPLETGIAIDWIPAHGSVHQVMVPQEFDRSYPAGPNTFRQGATQPVPGPHIPADPSWLAAHVNHPVTVPATSGDSRWRVLLENVSVSNGSTGTIVLAVDASSAYKTLGQLAAVDFVVSVILLLGLLVIGVAVVRRSLRPLTDIEQTAGAIAAGDLSRRVPERDPRTEVGRLGRSLNAMLSQIETAFHARSQSEASARRSEEKMRQFVADASHELRTPLTAIRGFAEYYRQRGGVDTGGTDSGQLASADLDRIMRRVEQEASRMGILVEDMLLLARLDQQRPLESRPVDLLSLAADAVHDARVVAPDRSINLTVGAGAALLVIGDEVRLRQVIGNLMSNALTHTPEGTPIDVLIRSGNLDEAPVGSPPPPPPNELAASSADDNDVTREFPATAAAASPDAEHSRSGRPAAVLEVADHGPGLTREHADHVFERFYRADQSRTAGGTGLGLAIVAALVAAHGGVAWVRSPPGAGATFCIALPLSPDAAQGSDDDLDAEDMSDTGALDDSGALDDGGALDDSGTLDDGSPPRSGRDDTAWLSANTPDRAHGHVT